MAYILNLALQEKDVQYTLILENMKDRPLDHKNVVCVFLKQKAMHVLMCILRHVEEELSIWKTRLRVLSSHKRGIEGNE